MTIRDYSINSDNPNNAESEAYIKSQILAPRIRDCEVMVVYISPETKDSEYVHWEIEYAQSQNRRIVGVWAWGKKDAMYRKPLRITPTRLWAGTATISSTPLMARSMIGGSRTEVPVNREISNDTVASDHGSILLCSCQRFRFCPESLRWVLHASDMQAGDPSLGPDWRLVLGTGSARHGRKDHIVYAMKVAEAMTFNAYWADERFREKNLTCEPAESWRSATISITLQTASGRS